MKKQIQIRIFPDGTISSETINIKGSTCTKYKEQLEAMLLARTVDTRLKPEYYEQAEEYTYDEQKVGVNN